MEAAVTYAGYAAAVWLFLVGLYGVVKSRHLVNLCLSLTVVQSSTYVLLTIIGYRPGLPAPVFTDGLKPGSAAVDPIVQALMLTDIVVEATVVALLLAITIKIHRDAGTTDPDKVDMMRG
ncbi:MAG: sodium:proton antiporter [Candidatus Acidiferrales bacterium]